MKPANENLLNARELSRQMIILADKGDMEREDDGCGVLYGMIRDSAYSIRQMAEHERLLHQQMDKGG